MLRRKDDEIPEQHVRPWLGKMGFPLENYWNLSSYYKRLLHNQVCRCTRNSPSSDRQLRDLYQRLQSGESRGSIISSNAVDSMTNRELQEFFLPLSSSETLADLYKY
jgi:hypothetical protein